MEEERDPIFTTVNLRLVIKTESAPAAEAIADMAVDSLREALDLMAEEANDPGSTTDGRSLVEEFGHFSVHLEVAHG